MAFIEANKNNFLEDESPNLSRCFHLIQGFGLATNQKLVLYFMN